MSLFSVSDGIVKIFCKPAKNTAQIIPAFSQYGCEIMSGGYNILVHGCEFTYQTFTAMTDNIKGHFVKCNSDLQSHYSKNGSSTNFIALNENKITISNIKYLLNSMIDWFVSNKSDAYSDLEVVINSLKNSVTFEEVREVIKHCPGIELSNITKECFEIIIKNTVKQCVSLQENPSKEALRIEESYYKDNNSLYDFLNNNIYIIYGGITLLAVAGILTYNIHIKAKNYQHKKASDYFIEEDCDNDLNLNGQDLKDIDLITN